jgi:lycopene cyclase domain-containing protein
VLLRGLTYAAVLLICVLGTLPLELMLHARVYRRWRQALIAIVPVAAVFLIWDVLAVRDGWWRFDRRYVTGVFVGPLPVEEIAFFVVIPVCALLSFEAVRHLRPQWALGSSLLPEREPAPSTGDE